MYTHRICVVFVSNLLSAPSAHGAPQCFALSQGTDGGKAKRCEAPCADGADRRFDTKTTQIR